MRELDFHGKGIVIEDSLLIKYREICRQDINIDDMDLSIVNMLYNRFPSSTIDEWKQSGVLRDKIIDYALKNISPEEMTKGIIEGIEADIEIGEALYS